MQFQSLFPKKKAAGGHKHLIFTLLLLLSVSICPARLWAHQAPYSVIYLDVNPTQVAAELHIPLSELQLAYGQGLAGPPATLISRMGPQLKEYILAHTHCYVKRSEPWLISISQLKMGEEAQLASGPPFWELRVYLTLCPQHAEGTRHFTLDYDGVVHQVINHIIFVTIRHDWQTGRSDQLTAESNPMTIRISSDNQVHPLNINLNQGSLWTGFLRMMRLGMDHIKEGTDHLLFLLTLLLPAPLLTRKKKWAGFGGVSFSFKRLLKIITAFTIGHSITLMLGSLGLIAPSGQLIEILIAVSIAISALHALHPLFAQKEYLISGGFGLIHGMAFSTVLSSMQLSGAVLVLSILGFNLGIEIMQLFIVAMVVPWLILLSQTHYYRLFRIVGAIGALTAAIAWILQRATGQDNMVTRFIDQQYQNAIWLVIAMAILSITAYLSGFRKSAIKGYRI